MMDPLYFSLLSKGSVLATRFVVYVQHKTLTSRSEMILHTAPLRILLLKCCFAHILSPPLKGAFRKFTCFIHG